MAKDDYHVVVYQILSYLYQRLKNGEDVDGRQISSRSDFFHINEKYWNYIIVNIARSGYISGITLLDVDNADTRVTGLDRAQITLLGIEYLTENSTMEKAKQFFKDTKEIIPFI